MKAPNIIYKEKASHVRHNGVVWGDGGVFVEKSRCQVQPCFWSSYYFTSIGSSSNIYPFYFFKRKAGRGWKIKVSKFDQVLPFPNGCVIWIIEEFFKKKVFS